MSEHTTDNEKERFPVADGPDEPPALAADVVVSRDGPAECTIFPPEADDFERVTTWITAAEGSFVGLDEME